MKHGGDLLTYERRWGRELIDFSSNINPLGPPQGLLEKWRENFHQFSQYPDISYRELKRNVGAYLHCEPEQVLLGNGAVDIIDRGISLSDKLTLLTPCFGEYEERGRVHRKDILFLESDEDFAFDLQEFKSRYSGGTVLLGNPNNPTGYRLEKEILMEIYNEVVKNKGLLILDEAFYEFCPFDYDSIELFRPFDFQRVLIIRAATKFFALPGLRLGYGCTSPYWVQRFEELELPWAINTAAALSGEVIFQDTEYIQRSKEYIDKERNFLVQELEQLNISVYPGRADFLLLNLNEKNGKEALEFFGKRGILIRTCESFRGLSSHHIRIAVKSHEDNVCFINTIKEWLHHV